MRKVLLRFVLCLAAAFCPGLLADAYAQSDNYDKALDKYAYICERCVDLRGRLAAGQNVELESFKSLLKELSELRKTLSGASGKMSAAQVARFERIKERYSQGSLRLEAAEGRPEWKSVPRLEAKCPTGVLTGLATGLSLPDSPGSLAPSGDVRTAARRGHPSSEAIRTAILADAGISPAMSYGAMAVVTWKGVGAYADFRSDFRKNEYSYVASGKGATGYGHLWTTGKSRVSRMSAAAGLAMFISGHFGFRAGAGWTSYRCCWEDSSGQWAKINDESFGNFAVDGGIFLVFKPLVLSVGVMSDFSGNADLNFGIGFRF